jgi:hypothetical protein
MVRFSSDVDILKYEPMLFGELHLSGQVLTAGTGGVLDGTTFAADGADFAAAQVAAGDVVYLRSADGSVDGGYEMVSVDSATQLTVSVVRADSSDEAIPPAAAVDVSYRVCTYRPQVEEVGYQLTEYFGIKPGDTESDISVEDILEPGALKRASVFGVLTAVYAMLASKAGDENFWKKSLHYQRLFEQAKERCRVSIDAGSDGVADVVRFGGAGRLRRD